MRKLREHLCDWLAFAWVLLTTPADPNPESATAMKNFVAICQEYWRSLTAAIVLSVLFWMLSVAVSRASMLLGMPGSSGLVNFLDRGTSLFLSCFFAELVLL
jgi:hypothetical protein